MGISRQLYNQVMMLDDFTCVYCGQRGPDMSADHYIPRSLGGPDVIQNLVTACRSCNMTKQDRAPYEWKVIAQYGRFSYVRDYLKQQEPKPAYIQDRHPLHIQELMLDPQWADEIFQTRVEAVERIVKGGKVGVVEAIELIFDCKRNGRPDSVYGRARAAIQAREKPQYRPATPEQQATRRELQLDEV